MDSRYDAQSRCFQSQGRARARVESTYRGLRDVEPTACWTRARGIMKAIV